MSPTKAHRGTLSLWDDDCCAGEDGSTTAEDLSTVDGRDDEHPERHQNPLDSDPGALADEHQEQIHADKSAETLEPPVDASKFEQTNEGPATMVDLTDRTDAGAEDVVDASTDIDF